MVEKVGQAEKAVYLLLRGEIQAMEDLGGDGQPEGGGVHFILGQAQVSGADIFHGVEFNFFETDDLGSDVDFSVRDGTFFELLFSKDVKDFDFSVVNGVGEVINVSSSDIGLSLAVIEVFDKILLSLADVDGLWMKSGQCR